MSTATICIIDFCGYFEPGHMPTTFWADWHPETKLITFGGDWWEIAPVLSETEPSDDEIEALEQAAWWMVTGN